jgi:hypothetical protein
MHRSCTGQAVYALLTGQDQSLAARRELIALGN